MALIQVLFDSLRGAVLVTGLVVVMMMVIESFNVESEGRLFRGLRRSRFAQVVLSALLGAVPGCIGGFAVVSMYTHRMLGFGALLAMMIATVGDESFMMLAMFPAKAAALSAGLFVLAIAVGLLVDSVSPKPLPTRLEDSFELHSDECGHHHGHGHGHGCGCGQGDGGDDHQGLNPENGEYLHSGSEPYDRHHSGRHLGRHRVFMALGVALFVVILLAGLLEDEPEISGTAGSDALSVFNEEWIFWIFGALSLVVLAALVFASDHFVEEHLWSHIVKRHLPTTFAWTFGVLLAIGILFHFVDLSSWVNDNTALMILLAVLVGLVPQSGPHLVFVTLFASGVIPFPVLLANSIVQDGHASLPLLADSKSSFVKAKAIKVVLALVVSFGWLLV